VKQLNDIINMNRFDYIVIEASGICEPAPIAQTISTYADMIDPSLLKNGVARLDAIVTVVDAKRMRDEFGLGDDLQRKDIGEEDLASLVIQQIEFCNIILLNKADEVSHDDLEHIRGIIKAIQPKAEIYECNYGDVDLNKIINTHSFDFDKVASSARWIEAIEDEDGDLENEESGEALEYGIGTFVYERREPLDLARFDEFVSTKWPKTVIRAKGICYFRDELETCYVFEQAGRQFNIRNAGQWYATMPKDQLEDLMERNPAVREQWDEKYGDRMQKLVFIGQNMDRAAIEKDLDECIDK
jgi:G3E family GTPase